MTSLPDAGTSVDMGASLDLGLDADSGAASDLGPDWAPNTEAFEALVQSARAEMRLRDAPGMAIGVVEHGELTQSIGLGVIQRGTTSSVTPQTVFSAGSISKSMIAAAAMSAVQSGALSLDAPIHDYYPDFQVAFPHSRSAVTLRTLLSHTSGYPTFLPWTAADQTIPSGSPEGLQMYFDRHNMESLWVQPGRLYNYSNIGFSLAALIVQRASGQPWSSLIQQEVFAPLGMETASFQAEGPITENFAYGHTEGQFSETLVGPQEWGYSSIGGPNGGLWANVLDLSKFGVMLLDPPEGWEQMQQAQSATEGAYGLGMQLGRFRGLSYVGHSGAIPGFQAVVLAVPEEEFAVAVMTNTDRLSPFSLAFEAFTRFLQPSEPDSPIPPAPPENAIIGRYQDPSGYLGTLSVEASESGLELVFEDLNERRPLQHFSGKDFFVRNAPVLPGVGVAVPVIVLSFWLDDDGQAEFVASRLGVAHKLAP